MKSRHLVHFRLKLHRYEPRHDKTNKVTVRTAKTQISLGIHPVWSESSLSAQWVAKNPRFLHAESEDSDQTGRMPRLIWVFAGRTCHFVGFVVSRFRYIWSYSILCITNIRYCISWTPRSFPWKLATFPSILALARYFSSLLITLLRCFQLHANN